MKYSTYKLMVSFPGDEVIRHFEVVAVDVEAAQNDLRESHGEFELIQWGTK